MKYSAPLPHSWSIDDWPPGAFPGSPARGRYLVRMYRREMLQAGALARVGRSLIVIGERYGRFLEKRAARVPDFEIAANRKRGQQASA